MTHGNGRKVVLASRNRDKVRELQQIFADTPFEVLCAGDFPGLPDVIEDGTTILGNATRKAMLTAAYTGEIALADDTSLEVRELNGWPDIFAARFSGPGATYASNSELVLELMAEVPDQVRSARFCSACVWVDPRPAAADRELEPDAFAVLSPVARRWLRNPWAATRPFQSERFKSVWAMTEERHSDSSVRIWFCALFGNTSIIRLIVLAALFV